MNATRVGCFWKCKAAKLVWLLYTQSYDNSSLIRKDEKQKQLNLSWILPKQDPGSMRRKRQCHRSAQNPRPALHAGKDRLDRPLRLNLDHMAAAGELICCFLGQKSAADIIRGLQAKNIILDSRIALRQLLDMGFFFLPLVSQGIDIHLQMDIKQRHHGNNSHAF